VGKFDGKTQLAYGRRAGCDRSCRRHRAGYGEPGSGNYRASGARGLSASGCEMRRAGQRKALTTKDTKVHEGNAIEGPFVLLRVLGGYFLGLDESDCGAARKCRTVAFTSNCLPARSRTSVRTWSELPSSEDQTCPMVPPVARALSTEISTSPFCTSGTAGLPS